MTDADLYAPILALRRRLAELEKQAAAQAPPVLTDRTPNFGDALRKLAAEGTASGPGVDRLRREVAGRPEPATAPSREELAEATRRVVGDLSGSDSIEAAYEAMKLTAARRTAIETVSPGSSGRIDVLRPGAAGPIDKIRKALEERP
jgi:hypothetical protein